MCCLFHYNSVYKADGSFGVPFSTIISLKHMVHLVLLGSFGAFFSRILSLKQMAHLVSLSVQFFV